MTCIFYRDQSHSHSRKDHRTDHADRHREYENDDGRQTRHSDGKCEKYASDIRFSGTIRSVLKIPSKEGIFNTGLCFISLVFYFLRHNCSIFF